MRNTILAAMLAGTVSYAQVAIPDGTKLRVRLDQTITSATADEGQTVELSVTENVKVGDAVVFPQGSRVTGTITIAQEKRRMGRAGKLDFSVDRVRAVDGEWVPLRYTLNKKTGDSHAVRTGIVTAGVAVVFWPAAPFMLLMKGKDVTINKGVTLDVFTDSDYLVKAAPAAGVHMAGVTVPGIQQPGAQAPPAAAQAPAPSTGGMASVAVTSTSPGADIEVDGAFVGSTPTTLQLASGMHHVTVRNGAQTWQRSVQINAGSNVTLQANFPEMAPAAFTRTSSRAR